MEIQEFTALISSVGFPIAACIALAVYCMWDRKQRKEELDKRDDVIEKLRGTLQQNTIALEKLIERIDK